MKTRIALGAFAVVALSMTGVMAAEGVKSGVPVGKTPRPFNPQNITGPYAGTKTCLV